MSTGDPAITPHCSFAQNYKHYSSLLKTTSTAVLLKSTARKEKKRKEKKRATSISLYSLLNQFLLYPDLVYCTILLLSACLYYCIDTSSAVALKRDRERFRTRHHCVRHHQDSIGWQSLSRDGSNLHNRVGRGGGHGGSFRLVK
jgi:hypothetical protein